MNEIIILSLIEPLYVNRAESFPNYGVMFHEQQLCDYKVNMALWDVWGKRLADSQHGARESMRVTLDCFIKDLTLKFPVGGLGYYEFLRDADDYCNFRPTYLSPTSSSLRTAFQKLVVDPKDAWTEFELTASSSSQEEEKQIAVSCVPERYVDRALKLMETSAWKKNLDGAAAEVYEGALNVLKHRAENQNGSSTPPARATAPALPLMAN